LDKEQISSEIDSIKSEMDASYENKKAKAENLYNYYKSYLEKYPESPYLADIYFQMAEITYELFPHDDYNTYQQIINYLHKVLAAKSDFPQKDVIYFNIAYFDYFKQKINISEERIKYTGSFQEMPSSLFLTKDKVDTSIKYYRKIIKQFPRSAVFDESIYRMGDLYFDLANDTKSSQKRKEYLNEAKNYYKQLSFKECDLQEEASYKLGWVYFSLNDYSSAIANFVELLNKITFYDSIVHSDMSSGETDFAKNFVQGAQIFEKEIIKYVALSFAGYDSTNYSSHPIGTDKFEKIFDKIKSVKYAQKILLELCLIYKNVGYQNKALASYNVFLKLFPLYKNNPLIRQELIQSYANMDSISRAEDEKEKITVIYTSDSDWYKTYQDSQSVLEINLPIINNAYDYILGNTINNLVDTKKDKFYHKAIYLSEQYLNLFPDSTETMEVEKNLAQIFF